MSKRYTESSEAYVAYQTGRALWEQMRPESFRKAVEYFEKAADIDPAYMKPLVGLADVFIWAAVYGHAKPSEAFAKAKLLAARALENDEQLAGAHCSLAFVRLWDGEFEDAEKAFRRALELNPFYSNAYQGYGLLLMARQEFERALETVGKAIETRSGRFLNYAILGIIYYEWGKDDEAVEALEECQELNPYFDAAYFGLALVYTKLERYRKAAGYARKALKLSGFSTLNRAVLGYIYAVSGREAEAREIADKLSREYEQKYTSPYHLSVLFARLGEPKLSEEWAEKSEQAKDPWRLVRAFDFRSSNPRR